jgi:hypothetical protein
VLLLLLLLLLLMSLLLVAPGQLLLLLLPAYFPTGLQYGCRFFLCFVLFCSSSGGMIQQQS